MLIYRLQTTKRLWLYRTHGDRILRYMTRLYESYSYIILACNDYYEVNRDRNLVYEKRYNKKKKKKNNIMKKNF